MAGDGWRAVSEQYSLDAGFAPFERAELARRRDPGSPPPAAALAAGPAMIRAVRMQVLPRLVLAHHADDAAVPRREHGGPVSPKDVAALTAMLLSPNREAAAFVGALLSHGQPLESVFLDLIAPCARRLGDMWMEDTLDMASVTMALSRLQYIVREFTPNRPDMPDERSRGRRALLVPTPGENHTLGLSMVCEFFRRSGWHVTTWPCATRAELLTAVRRDSFSVAGFTVSSEVMLETLAGTIRAIRQTSINPQIGIMVGGSVFNEHPEYVALLGADATANDARQAPLQADQLVALLMDRA